MRGHGLRTLLALGLVIVMGQGLEAHPAFPSLTLKRLDVFAFLEAVVADPGLFWSVERRRLLHYA